MDSESVNNVAEEERPLEDERERPLEDEDEGFDEVDNGEEKEKHLIPGIGDHFPVNSQDNVNENGNVESTYFLSSGTFFSKTFLRRNIRIHWL